MSPVAKSVEEYLAALPAEQRQALERLRATIRALVPDATEVISYGVPTFKRGKGIVAVGAGKDHCSLFVMSTAVMDALRGEFAGFDTAKGTVHFRPDTPLPEGLVREVVEARLAENEGGRRAYRARQP